MRVLDVEVPGASGVKGVLVHGVRCVTGVDVVVNLLSSEVVGGKVDSDRVPCSDQLVRRMDRVVRVTRVSVTRVSVTHVSASVLRVVRVTRVSVTTPMSSEVVGGKVDGDRVPCSEQLVGRVSGDCITCVRC